MKFEMELVESVSLKPNLALLKMTFCFQKHYNQSFKSKTKFRWHPQTEILIEYDFLFLQIIHYRNGNDKSRLVTVQSRPILKHIVTSQFGTRYFESRYISGSGSRLVTIINTKRRQTVETQTLISDQ